MTLDDVAAAMRDRFTKSQGAPVTLTAAEWNVLASAIYLRDVLVEAMEKGAIPVERAEKALARTVA